MNEKEKELYDSLMQDDEFSSTAVRKKKEEVRRKLIHREDIKLFFALQKKEFIKNKNIVLELVKRNVKVQYRNSAIGILWTVLNPLLNMLVMFFVFSTLFGYTDKTYALYLLCGNIIFNTMRSATYQALPSLVNNRGLLTKNKISYTVFPLSNNISAMVNFLFSYIALLAVMVFTWVKNGVQPFSVEIFKTFFMLPALFLFSFGISLVLCSVYVFFRDIMHFYTVFLTLWMYLTPIFYKIDMLQGKDDLLSKAAATVISKINPMYSFVTYFREITYGLATGVTPVPTISLATLYIWGAVMLGIGALVFNLTRHRFIFNI